jgi:peroxiredoxin
MNRTHLFFRTIPGAVLAVFLAILVPSARLDAGTELPNISLIDVNGKNHDLHRAQGKAVVLFFTGVGCPIARKSAPKLRELEKQFQKDGVTFWCVNSYPEDKPADIFNEANEFGSRGFVQLRDPRQGTALALGVKRTAEVVAVSTKDWKVFYQGAIDDQYSEGSERPEPQTRFLQAALSEFLADQPIKTPKTSAHGCLLAYSKVSDAENAPTYTRDVAPILKEHCVHCHQKGDIGQWSMDGYGTVKNNSAMMVEVLLERRMPPWDPDPDYGHFTLANRLSRDEVQTLISWSKAGAPRGEGEDPLAQAKTAPTEWELGTPNIVLRPKEIQTIPATGVLEYRQLPIEFPIEQELWISGMEVKPGNRKVVHHAILYGKWDGAPDNGDSKGVFLVGWAPGTPPLRYPAGAGKRLPPNAKLTLEVHYTVCGSEQTDQTAVALYFWPGPQPKLAETRQAIEWDLNIPPGIDESRYSATYAFKKPATIYSLAPHMHIRGKNMRYELLLPDGNRETLLSVPKYDFNWQFTYPLTEPRHVPAGTWLLVTGAFDNSAAKHQNPDPSKRVHFGSQSWDEMFIGFFDAADDPVAPASTERASALPAGSTGGGSN